MTERLQAVLLGTGGFAAVIVVWQAVSGLAILDPTSFPPPSSVADSLVEQAGTSQFWAAIGDTLESTTLGLMISVAIALPLGVALGVNTWAFRSFRLMVEFLKPIPVVAILPLALLIYGTALEMKLLLISFGTLWPLLIQMMYGVQSVDPLLRETARSFRLGPRRRLINLVLPSAAPYVATGLRLAAVTALVLSIVTELIGGAAGLGFEMSQAQRGAAYPVLYALIIVSGVLGVAVNWSFARLERRFLTWHESQRVEVLP